MPDPDRRPRDRYASDAYRYNARDSRYPYRWNPDRFEERFRDRDERRPWDLRWSRDARDRDDGPGDCDRYDFDRCWSDRNRGGYYEGDFGPEGWREQERAREFGGRGCERDWRDRQRWGGGSDFDEEERWRNRRW